jgi:DNA-binding MarR family transcriptional regulator
MRMAALADTVQLSPSGLSRAIERLEARGLVTRQQRDDDRRGVDAVLTAAGTDLLRAASETHAAAIERRFFAHLTLEERQAIRPISARLLAANGQPLCQGACPSSAWPIIREQAG